MSETWLQILKQLEPNYDSLKDMLDNGPQIVANLRAVNNKWRVRLEESWLYNGDQYYTADYSNLDQRCEWANEQLTNWRFVYRISHQEWTFFNREQAEKFLTLYNLRWAE